MCQHVALVFGTRPEAIKLFPVIYALRERTSLRISVLVTGQHRAMLDQVLAVADIRPDVDLDIMVPNQSLDGLTARLLLGIGEAFDALTGRTLSSCKVIPRVQWLRHLPLSIARFP